MNSYSNPVKNCTRRIKRDFIERNLLSSKSPREITVLCFPGAQNDNEVGLEIMEVYDPLGIPRQNIVGIENQPQRFERLRSANLGIECFRKDMVEFLEHAKTHNYTFDIISLDWQGYVSPLRVYCLDLIAGDQLLRPESVLITNFIGCRENEEARKIITEKAEDNGISVEDKNLKSRVFSQIVSDTLLRGSYALRPAFFEKEFYSHLREIVENSPVESEIRKVEGRSLEEKLIRSIALRKRDRTFGMWASLFDREDFREEFFEFLDSSRPYTPMDHESYKYSGTVGAPMYLDLFAFSQEFLVSEDFWRGNETIADVVYDEKNLRFLREYFTKNFFNRARRELGSAVKEEKIIENVEKKIEKTEIGELMKSKAQELIDNARTSKVKPLISKEDVQLLLFLGYDTKTLCELFQGFTRPELGSLKAHITRGTHGNFEDWYLEYHTRPE